MGRVRRVKPGMEQRLAVTTWRKAVWCSAVHDRWWPESTDSCRSSHCSIYSGFGKLVPARGIELPGRLADSLPQASRGKARFAMSFAATDVSGHSGQVLYLAKRPRAAKARWAIQAAYF